MPRPSQLPKKRPEMREKLQTIPAFSFSAEMSSTNVGPSARAEHPSKPVIDPNKKVIVTGNHKPRKTEGRDFGLIARMNNRMKNMWNTTPK